MKNIKKDLFQTARKAHELIDEVKGLWPSSDPIKIEAYRGYASEHRIFLKGRVLEDDNIMVSKSQEELKRILYSFKRFETDEIPGVRVHIHIFNQTYERYTDEEGYFVLDIPAPKEILSYAGNWLMGYAELPDLEGENGKIRSTVELFMPNAKVNYGIISDIDDTLLQTHVTSLLQLKMMFVTLFKDASERLAMDGMVELYQEMVQAQESEKNPFFYVSNSPWNIYPQLLEFLEIHQLPKGPVLLRDVGFSLLGQSENHRGHKIETISHILKTYPEMSFILFGDTGSKDADVYVTLAKEFSGQIKTIYIRNLKNTKNARRVASLIDQQKDVDAKLITSTQEIVDDAKRKGYINTRFELS